MTDVLAELFSEQISVYRKVLANIAAERGLPRTDPPWPNGTSPIDGASLTDPALRVAIVHSFQSAGDLGSFRNSLDPVCLRIHVQGYSSQFPNRQSARSNLLDEVSEAEGEAWARALLGKYWSDYAYELLWHRRVSDRVRARMWYKQRIYVVLLAQNGTPLLAPDNFAWSRVWHAIEHARKLDPDPSSNELLSYIERFGPYAVTAGIRDPHTEPDGGWRVEMTGESLEALTETARETLRHLRNKVRVRGVVDSAFRPVRIHVEDHSIVVYFHWAKNPNTFALSVPMPQSPGDFRGPPVDTPGRYASEALFRWQEDLRTGLLVWGIRTRIGKTIHVSTRRIDHEHCEFGIGPVPMHEKSGVWLADAGLSIETPRASINSGTLAAWIQAYPNKKYAKPFVGHAAARWLDQTTACIDVLEVVQGTESVVTGQLAHIITHTLANMGARLIETPFDCESLAALGYEQRPIIGGMQLDVTTMP
ncbi:hypothetical protein [Hoyosella altamirensis]|uniref:Uncharacterized protein n=1 Tax=Hoyosella altamirensis TaxID=616997 RepID=A0A839RK18_9ACTN|nr:hypothetical protein [Hoyosella altamirensis]MBB3037005.1 hypothetical protein [Hoyosella altamirensis]